MNNVCILGEITWVDDLRQTIKFVPVVNLTVKTIRPRADSEPEFAYHSVKLWAGLAEKLYASLEVGKYLSLNGRIKYQKYEKPGFGTISMTSIYADDAQVLNL